MQPFDPTSADKTEAVPSIVPGMSVAPGGQTIAAPEPVAPQFQAPVGPNPVTPQTVPQAPVGPPSPATPFSPQLPNPNLGRPTGPTAPMGPAAPLGPPPPTNAMFAGGQPLPPQPPASPSRFSKKPILLVALIVFVLGIGSAAAYFGVVAPNKPENVLKAAIQNSLQEKQASFEGSIDVKDSSSSAKIKFSGAVDQTAKTSQVKVDATLSGVSASVEARYIDKNLYFKLGDLSNLAKLAGSYSPEIGTAAKTISDSLSNQWLEVDSTLLDQLGGSCVLDANSQFTDTDIKLLESQYSKHQFSTIKSSGTDTVNGQKATKYELSLDDDKMAAYLKDLGGLSMIKALKACDTGLNADSSTFSSLADHDQTPLTVWVDGSKHIVKLGVNSTAKDAKSGVSGTGSVTLKYDKVSVSKPSGAKPAMDVLNDLQSSLETLILDSGSLFSGAPIAPGSDTVNDGVQQKARNTKRQTDIRSLQTQLEAFYAENGYYPSLADMNSESWLKTNMKSLDPNAKVDPSNANQTTGVLLAAPAAKSYSYAVTDTNGKSCESDDTNCAKYILTATYEGNVNGATTLVKNNLD